MSLIPCDESSTASEWPLFDVVRCVGHRFGAACPFQPAQRNSIDVCVVDDLDSRTHKCGAAPLHSQYHLHKAGDRLRFRRFAFLSRTKRVACRDLARPYNIHLTLDISSNPSKSKYQSPCQIPTAQHKRTTTSQQVAPEQARTAIRSRRTSATGTMVSHVLIRYQVDRT